MQITKSTVKSPDRDIKMELARNLSNRAGPRFYKHIFISHGFPDVAEIQYRKMLGLGSRVDILIVDDTVVVRTFNPWIRNGKSSTISGGIIKDVAEDLVDEMLGGPKSHLMHDNGLFSLMGDENIIPVHNALKLLSQDIEQNTDKYKVRAIPYRSILRKKLLRDIDGKIRS
jgi:hypothetical protein